MFNPDSRANRELVRAQVDKLATRNSIECQRLYQSIEARALVICFQILGKSKNKDTRAPEIEELKIQASRIFKKIEALKKKIEVGDEKK